MAVDVLGLDVGGAHLKAAHTRGMATTRPFSLWKHPKSLPGELSRLIARFPRYDLLAVTMTGELCDCFDSGREGVMAILDAVSAVAGRKPSRVWNTQGRFTTLDEARAAPDLAAASNWLALGEFAGRNGLLETGVVIDVGSTTTDIIPVRNNRPCPSGIHDPQRMKAGELVYTGAQRTPVCAILGPEVAAEVFATSLDVYLILGMIAEDPANHNTADGRQATHLAARSRLARMLCADPVSIATAEIERLAERAHRVQVDLIARALTGVLGRLGMRVPSVVIAGSGEFLAQACVQRVLGPMGAAITSLEAVLGKEISHAACAHAVAVLAAGEAS